MYCDGPRHQEYDGVLRFALSFFGSKVTGKNVNHIKSSVVMFGLQWKGQNVTYGGKLLYSCTQDITYPSFLLQNSIVNSGQMSWAGVAPSLWCGLGFRNSRRRRGLTLN